MIDKSKFDLVGFGEIMLRLSPPRHFRFTDSDAYEIRAGGAELNVAGGVALLGMRTGVISMVPKNDLGIFIKNRIRFSGVSDDYLQYDNSEDARLGSYYYEMGAAPRKPKIIYDRQNSSFNKVDIDKVTPTVYSRTKIFHVSGITLALGEHTRNSAIELVKRFKEGGARISFDVNYRANLWTEEEAKQTIEKILPYVDILFISEETSRKMFKKEGTMEEIQKSYCDEYGVDIVATTQRTVISPRKHNFTSIIYHAKTNTHYSEKPYTDIDVIDRIGSGDAYVAGALYGILAYDDPKQAMIFGNATSALKNTVPGDLPVSDLNEVLNIIKDHSSDGPKTEMNR